LKKKKHGREDKDQARSCFGLGKNGSGYLSIFKDMDF
jgi:hypothetical protein